MKGTVSVGTTSVTTRRLQQLPLSRLKSLLQMTPIIGIIRATVATSRRR